MSCSYVSLPNRVRLSSIYTQSGMVVLTILFVLAMHFFMRGPGGEGLALPFNATSWMVLTAFLGLGVFRVAFSKRWYYSRFSLVLLCCCVLMTIPVCYSNADVGEVAPRLIGLWAGWVLFSALQQMHCDERDHHRVLWLIIIAVFIECLFGFIQYLWLDVGNEFGYDTEQNRPYGIFQQPNVMASFMATGLLLSSYLLGQLGNNPPPRLLTFLSLVIALTTALLVVLASRTGWLCAVIGLMMILPYMKKHCERRLVANWTMALICGFVLSFIMMHIAFPEGGSLAPDKLHLQSPRAYTFPQTLEMIMQQPLFGHGYGQFERVFLEYSAQQYALTGDFMPLHSMAHPHNEFLYWSIEGGLLPLLGMLGAMGVTLNIILKCSRGTRLAVLALFMPLIIHSQLEFPFYHSLIHWVIFVILLYWAEAHQFVRLKRCIVPSTIGTLLCFCSLLCLGACTIFMLGTLHTNYWLSQYQMGDRQEPKLLEEIVHPFAWKERLEWEQNSLNLLIGITTRDERWRLEHYVKWAENVIQKRPRPEYYRNLILAYQALGDQRLSAERLKEAEFLFPGVEFRL